MLVTTFSFLIVTGFALLLQDLAPTYGSTREFNYCRGILDFEDDSQENCLSLKDGKGKISFSTSVAKHGKRSLKWQSGGTSKSVLQYDVPTWKYYRRYLWNGGIKMWIYRETAVKGKTMEVRIRDNERNAELGMFKVDMGFKGWRAIWVSLRECRSFCDSLNPPMEVTHIDFVLTHSDTIYFDLLFFTDNISRQSRDKIVPPFTTFGSIYDASDVWQRSYHWSQQTPTALPATVDPSKTLSLTHIESRLKNWYCDETKTSYDFTGSLKARWDTLTKSFDQANVEYDKLTLEKKDDKSVISGPPLFCRNSKQGEGYYSTPDPEKKFSFITAKVLLPLALEFYLKSRQNELTKTVSEETPRLNSKDFTEREKSLQKISKNKGRREEFSKFLNSASQGSPYNEQEVRRSLEYINKVRLQRIINVLDYLEDQGWADGSGLGSLDHEMNGDGAGFMHTLFLLKESLHQDSGNKSRLLNLIKTAKWYNDFGEIYQTTFEYNGTTADRMATIMLFRLMIVLIMPASTENERKARQRDMDALKRWMDNALTINKAFGGVIKPDYTSFHHQAFYASAYAPDALHTAAQVQYLLEGTDYALSEQFKQNLRIALKTLRLTAVKYSTPSSVGGHFPDFSKAILIDILPAYAYVSVLHPKPLPEVPAGGIDIVSIEMKGAPMFSRLYQPTEAQVIAYLNEGQVQREMTYMNSLGSLQIMSLVKSKSVAESSPEGHWSKNFAALSIHRRKDWAVTVKGFNRFVWDFESYRENRKSENVYDIFASHGSMLIANSEKALKAHDVRFGWDWIKIPGATTIPLNDINLHYIKSRNFSPLSSAGGVSFKGSESLLNGVFGMDFHQPDYEYIYPSWLHRYPIIKLHFKKSVFFYQNLLVCLGSSIAVDNGGKTNARTTLFQDKLIRGGSSFSIEVDGATKDSSAPFPAMNPLSQSGNKGYTTLVDTKGNSYYIPGSSASNLRVHVKTQNSQTPAARLSSGIYATAWLEHNSPNDFYEYAIWINTDSYANIADRMWARQKQENDPRPYQILKQDDKAHVVSFDVIPKNGNGRSVPLYGYVIFGSAKIPQGPIEAVSKQCRIMAEETACFVYLSISYPDLNFPFSKVIKSSRDIKVRELFHMESNEMEIEVTLRVNVEQCFADDTPKVNGSPTDYVPRVQVEASAESPPGTGNKIVFSNLKNGFSVEVKLEKRDARCS